MVRAWFWVEDVIPHISTPHEAVLKEMPLFQTISNLNFCSGGAEFQSSHQMETPSHPYLEYSQNQSFELG